MSDAELDEDVRRFLVENVETYDQLDALLLLARDPGVVWTVERLAERLGLPPPSAQAALAHLACRRLLRAGAVPGAFGFDAAHAGIVASLERAYAADRLAVVRWMNARAIARVRAEALRTFADAFLFRKKKGDG
jgi:hypothetical protein